MTNIPGTQLISRVVNILRVFSDSRQTASVTEIARLTDLHPSTTHRILQALVSEGLLDQDSRSEKYRLGYGLIELGEIAKKSVSLLEIIRPYMVELHNITHEYVTVDTLNINMWEVNTLDYIETTDYRIKIQPSPGVSLPANCAATGKVQLAYILQKSSSICEKKLKGLTPYSITDPTHFMEHLTKVRNEGYAVSDEELELGYVSVSAPIFDYQNKLVGAISVGAPKVRFTQQKVDLLVDPIIQIAKSISRELGSNTNKNFN